MFGPSYCSSRSHSFYFEFPCPPNRGSFKSTGIYWISLYEVLEQYGFEVRVVNARHVKNVPGRTKSDVLDCQWIRKL
ncbi:MAG: transposase, partial [Verrucomicrobia bacterium]|nr:transposase [Verrucomicrobiota bacterium]